MRSIQVRTPAATPPSWCRIGRQDARGGAELPVVLEKYDVRRACAHAVHSLIAQSGFRPDREKEGPGVAERGHGVFDYRFG